MMNSIFVAKLKEKGRNHLYDDLDAAFTSDNEEGGKDFTEDDLKIAND